MKIGNRDKSVGNKVCLVGLIFPLPTHTPSHLPLPPMTETRAHMIMKVV